MILYLDVLLISEMIIDYFILLSVKLITITPVKRFRLFLGAGISACFSLILLVPSLPVVFNIGYLLFSALIIVLSAFSFQSVPIFFKHYFWYLFLNCCYGGFIFFLSQLLRLHGFFFRNFICYIQISPIFLISSILTVYLIIRLLLFFGEPHQAIRKTITVSIEGMLFSAEVLYDTGFQLSDCMTGQPVLLLTDYTLLSPALQNELTLFGQNQASRYPFRVLPAASLFGDGILTAITADYILYQKKKITPVTIAFYPKEKMSDLPQAIGGYPLFSLMDTE